MYHNAKWPVPFSSYGEFVDWMNVEQQMYSRSRPNGFSVGPQDILEGSDALLELEHIVKKDLKEECQKIANGIDHNGRIDCEGTPETTYEGVLDIG